MNKRCFVMLCLLTILASCATKKDMFVLMPDPDGKVGEITVYNTGGEAELTKAFESVQFTDKKIAKPSVVLSEQEVNKTFDRVLKAIPKAPDKYILYFIFGTSDLTQKSKEKLPLILESIKRRIPCDVSVVGHTDTKGDEDNNLNLSLQRANMVKAVLLKIGVNPKQIEVSSHGEADLLIPTQDNVSEPRNRRVEVFVR